MSPSFVSCETEVIDAFCGQARRSSQSEAVALQAIRNTKGNNLCVDCEASSKFTFNTAKTLNITECFQNKDLSTFQIIQNYFTSNYSVVVIGQGCPKCGPQAICSPLEDCWWSRWSKSDLQAQVDTFSTFLQLNNIFLKILGTKNRFPFINKFVSFNLIFGLTRTINVDSYFSYKKTIKPKNYKLWAFFVIYTPIFYKSMTIFFMLLKSELFSLLFPSS